MIFIKCSLFFKAYIWKLDLSKNPNEWAWDVMGTSSDPIRFRPGAFFVGSVLYLMCGANIAATFTSDLVTYDLASNGPYVVGNVLKMLDGRTISLFFEAGLEAGLFSSYCTVGGLHSQGYAVKMSDSEVWFTDQYMCEHGLLKFNPLTRNVQVVKDYTAINCNECNYY